MLTLQHNQLFLGFLGVYRTFNVPLTLFNTHTCFKSDRKLLVNPPFVTSTVPYLQTDLTLHKHKSNNSKNIACLYLYLTGWPVIPLRASPAVDNTQDPSLWLRDPPKTGDMANIFLSGTHCIMYE